MWKFYSCDWFIKGWQNRIVRYDSMRELLTANKGYANWYGQHHLDNRIDKCILQLVSLFGVRIVDDHDEADPVGLEFVPTWIDHTEEKYGKCLFLSFSGYNDDNASDKDEGTYSFMKTLSLSSLP